MLGLRSSKLGLSLIALAATLLVGEGLARVAHRVTGRPWDGERIERNWNEMASARQVFVRSESDRSPDLHDVDPDSRLVLSPYLGFDIVASIEALESDRRHLAGSEADATYDVVILGGSVAGLYGNQARARLVQALAAADAVAGRAVCVFNHARGGYKQPQSLAALSWDLALGMRPDAVILIDGFNEVALGNYNASQGFYPLQPSIHHWARVSANASLEPEAVASLFEIYERQRAATRHARLASASGVYRSALFGSLALLLLRRDAARTAAAYGRYEEQLGGRRGDVALAGPSFDAGGDHGVEIAVEGWAQCSRMMHAICAARGIAFLHVLQPTLHDAGSKPLTDEERAGASAPEAWVDGVVRGYDRLRAAGRTLADEGVVFVDASRVFEGTTETLYFDACHFVPRGSEILTDALAPALVAALAR